MKTLEEIVFDPNQCRVEIAALKKLLQSKDALAERKDILNFFKNNCPPSYYYQRRPPEPDNKLMNKPSNKRHVTSVIIG